MRNQRNFRTVGAIAIIIFAASVVSMADTTEGETDVQPELAENFGNSLWEFLGTKVVDNRKDYQTVRLSKRFGTMAKIQLRSINNSIDIDFVKLHFKNGETQEVELRPDANGDKFYTIDVKGGARSVGKLTFYNKDINGKTRRFDNNLEIWGVPTSNLTTVNNDQYYPKVRYDTYSNLVRREQYGRNESVVYCPR